MPFTDITDHSFHRAWNSIEAVYGIMNSQRQMIYIGETNDLKHQNIGRPATNGHSFIYTFCPLRQYLSPLQWT